MKVAIALCLALCAYVHAGVLPLGPHLVRVPSLDSAVITSDRLGGNFVYSTKEAHAYAAVNPVVEHVATPVAVSYSEHPVVYAHQPVSYAHQPVSYVHQPVSYVHQPVSYVQQPLVAEEPIKPIAVVQQPIRPIEVISHPSHGFFAHPIAVEQPFTITHPVHAVPLPGVVAPTPPVEAAPETPEATPEITPAPEEAPAAPEATPEETEADDTVAIEAE